MAAFLLLLWAVHVPLAYFWSRKLARRLAGTKDAKAVKSEAFRALLVRSAVNYVLVGGLCALGSGDPGVAFATALQFVLGYLVLLPFAIPMHWLGTAAGLRKKT